MSRSTISTFQLFEMFPDYAILPVVASDVKTRHPLP
jgi:hypothetical protein